MSNGNNPRGTTPHRPNATRNDNVRSTGPTRRSRKAFQWSDLAPDDIGKLVQSVTGTGAAIICGVTSDGGALSITILDGEERLRDWPSDPEQFGEYVEWVTNTFAVR